MLLLKPILFIQTAEKQVSFDNGNIYLGVYTLET